MEMSLRVERVVRLAGLTSHADIVSYKGDISKLPLCGKKTIREFNIYREYIKSNM